MSHYDGSSIDENKVLDDSCDVTSILITFALITFASKVTLLHYFIKDLSILYFYINF